MLKQGATLAVFLEYLVLYLILWHSAIMLRQRIAIIFILAMAMLVACSASADSRAYFTVTPMLGTTVKPYGILPLRIDLRTTGPFRGKIVVISKRSPRVRAELPINVGLGYFKFEIPLPVIPSPGGAKALIFLKDHKGRTVYEDALRYQRSTMGTYSYNQQENRPLVAWVGGAGISSHFSGMLSHLSMTDPSSLPENWQMYGGLDILVLPASSARKLLKSQADALIEWVHAGGRLVVDGACKDRYAENIQLFNTLGISIGKTQKTHKLKHTYQTNVEDYSGTKTNQTELLSLYLRPVLHETAECRDEHSLRAEVQYGLGCIVMTCVDLKKCVKENANLGDMSFLLMIMTGKTSFSESTDTFYYGRDQVLPLWTRNLFEATGLEPIPAVFVIVYLLIFIIIVCPIERIVLRRFRLLRWTWVVTSILVVLFCLLAGTISRISRGLQPRRSMLCIHDYAQHGGGKHLMFDCFVPSMSRSHTANYGSDSLIFEVSGGTLGVGALLDVSKGTMEFTSPVWSPHFMITTKKHSDLAPFSADISLKQDQLAGNISLLSKGFYANKIWLVWNKKIYSVDKDGENWKIGACLPIKSGPILISEPMKQGRQKTSSNVNNAIRNILNQLLVMEIGAGLGNLDQKFFVPSSLSQLNCSIDQAVLIALCDEGEILEISAVNPRIETIHIVRQIVNVGKEKNDSND